MISVRTGVIIIKIFLLFFIYDICILSVIDITPMRIFYLYY